MKLVVDQELVQRELWITSCWMHRQEFTTIWLTCMSLTIPPCNMNKYSIFLMSATLIKPHETICQQPCFTWCALFELSIWHYIMPAILICHWSEEKWSKVIEALFFWPLMPLMESKQRVRKITSPLTLRAI